MQQLYQAYLAAKHDKRTGRDRRGKKRARPNVPGRDADAQKWVAALLLRPGSAAAAGFGCLLQVFFPASGCVCWLFGCGGAEGDG
jgi:hypothetical protein